MRILVTDDSMTVREVLKLKLEEVGYEIIQAANGMEALTILQKDDPPRLAIVDWEMPVLNGVDLCERVRALKFEHYIYLIILTSRESKKDVTRGLQAGADDFIIKPPDDEELLCRVRTGERIVRLESTLATKIHDLEESLANVKSLQRLLPICMQCRRVRDKDRIWRAAEDYLKRYSGAVFSHGLCEECLKNIYPNVKKKE
jgi:phosphoserine phosphatase RsbU/P